MAASPEHISPRAASPREDEEAAFPGSAGDELRANLALALGSLEEVLGHPERLSAEDRGRLETAHRSCLRLRELGTALAEVPPAAARRLRPADDPELVALREAQAALRASEEKFSTAFSHSPLALTITSLDDGRLVEVNEGFVRLSGYTRDEAVGRAPEELGLWVEPEVRAERFARLRSGQPVPNVEARFRIKSGEELIGVIGSAVVEINGRPCVLSSVTDITERKKAEVVLHRQNERLVILSEALAGLLRTRQLEPITRELFPKVAAHLGVDTYFNYMVNEQGNALLLRSYAGISEETARRIERLDFGQSLCGTVAQTHQPIVEADLQTSSSHEAAVVRSLGIQAYACNPLMQGDRLLGTLSFASRTRERFDDDELEFLRLISGYVALAMERVQAEEALKQADRRKDEFLAMLAHELRNPLAPIRNAVHVLKLLGPADAREQWAREIIERQTEHLTRLVDDLLDVSRITRGKITLSREPLELSTIVHCAVEAGRPLIDARRHDLTVVLPPDPVRLEGDLTRLVQVVGNLLNNAAKFTDEGGHIELLAAREGDEAVLRVRDDGMGLPPTCCRTSSTSSPRPTARSTARRAASASASRWCGSSSRCTAGASKRRATAPAGAASSSCGSPPRLRPPRKILKPEPASAICPPRGGSGSWWSKTTWMRRR
jgi:PAS domain S-box-containing protein